MKKVLIVASSFSHIKSFHLPYIREFRRLGWEVHMAAGGDPCTPSASMKGAGGRAAASGGNPGPEPLDAGLAVSLPVRKSYFSPENLRACLLLRRLIKEQGYDLVITHTTLGAALARLAVKGLACRPRMVIVVHGYLFGPGAGLFPSIFLRAVEYLTEKETDKIITMNEWDRQWAARHFPEKERCSVPGMGVDMGKLIPLEPDAEPQKKTPQQNASLPKDAMLPRASMLPKEALMPQGGMALQESKESTKLFTLVYPAEFSARKNQAFLIRCMRSLPPCVRLVLPGEGALLSECKALAAELGLPGRVLFPGQVGRIGEVLSGADAVVSSSRSEGLPFCLMEGMLSGLPVIASDVKGNRDLVEDGVTGYLYAPNDRRSFVKAVRKLMKSRKQAARMGLAGRRKAQRCRLEYVLPEVMRAYLGEAYSLPNTTPTDARQTSAPLISILLAVYEPRLDWLRQQLESLNAQTYPNLRLYIRDDCSRKVPYEEIRRLAASCIRAFPYTIERNCENLGSNGTFELLTRQAKGDYFAYCDQDDVWLPEKLSVLQSCLEREGAELVCSDMYIIDGSGRRVADSMTKIRRHHIFHSGYGLSGRLLISNWVTGCAALIRSRTAKAALPFCPHMVHDQYLALCAAREGKIVSLPDRLLSYRVHGSNQTLAMAGVRDKESYFRVRIQELILRLEWLEARFSDNGTLSSESSRVPSAARRTPFSDDRALSAEISLALRWARARRAYFLGDRRAWRTILQYRRFSPLTSLFELAMADSPEGLFMWVVGLKRRNLV